MNDPAACSGVSLEQLILSTPQAAGNTTPSDLIIQI